MIEYELLGRNKFMNFFAKRRVALYVLLVRKLKKIEDYFVVPLWLKFRTKSFLETTLLFNMYWFEKNRGKVPRF
jgi:hypothetical protein